MPLAVVPPTRSSPTHANATLPKPARSTIVPRGIPSKPLAAVTTQPTATALARATPPRSSAAPAATTLAGTRALTDRVGCPSAPSQAASAGTATSSLITDSVDRSAEETLCDQRHQHLPSDAPTHATGGLLPYPQSGHDTPKPHGEAVAAAQSVARDRERVAGVARQATLGALVVYADWSEACTLFVPRALTVLRAHPDLADGALAVHVDDESCLCAYYAVDAVPCIIFRARPRGASWRWRGTARPIEIPHTRITGACSGRVLAARIDAAVSAFCSVVPRADVATTMTTVTMSCATSGDHGDGDGDGDGKL
nr:DNA pol iii gamma/tau subunit-like domain [Pandoravirus massiliensis]